MARKTEKKKPDKFKHEWMLNPHYWSVCYVEGHGCNFTHNVFPISTDDVLDKHLFLNSQKLDVIQVITQINIEKDCRIFQMSYVLSRNDLGRIYTSSNKKFYRMLSCSSCFESIIPGC